MVHRIEMKKSWKIVLGLLTTICVLAVFALFIQDNNERATSISIKSLKDATVQSGARIEELLVRAYYELALTEALYEEIIEDLEIDVEDLQMLSDETSFDYIEFVNPDGTGLSLDGNTYDASGRDYFQEGIRGKSGVTIVFDSLVTNENLVIFYMPLYYDGEIKGVLTGSYKESTMQEIMHTTFFGEEARTFICMQDGTIISSCNGGHVSESIFDEGNFNKELDPDVERELREALLESREYEFQYEGSSGTANAYVTTVGKGEWMLIQTFPSQVTSRFVRDANRAGIILLAELIVIFAVCLVVIQIVSSIHKRKLVLENIEKSYVVNGITKFFNTFIFVDLENETFRYLEGTKPKDGSCPQQGDYETLQKYLISLAGEEDERKRMESLFAKEVLQKKLSDLPYLRYEYRTGRDSGKWDGLYAICIKRVKGIPTEVLLAYADVTDAKNFELRSYEALKEAYQALESANKAKSNFLSNMSHDIRTPMNAIMGMTAIAAMNIDNPDRIRDCLDKITRSSRHLLGLINEVLDMSKIESGKIHFAEEEFNLSDVVENIVSMFMPQTQEKKQQFHVNVSNITHEEVIGDSMRLQQILINILGNGVKFTQEGGTISFNICEITSVMQGYGCYVFTFEDNGIGMEEDFIDRIFEPFVRARDSRTDKTEGTGLGMPIVKNLVEMMNGDIQVESKINEGSRFTVKLYLKLNYFKNDDVKELENLNVLVADDEQDACENACNLLREIGMNADSVLSGAEAVDKLLAAHEADKDYSAVILDWKMPEMDGVETAKVIRKNFGEDVPIIILSAFDYSEIEQEARNAGVNAFISKPLFRSRLIYIMKSLMLSEEEQYSELEKLQKKDYAGKRVLLVEDNEINMEIAEELLSQKGLMVDKAENGRIAVERVHEMPEGYYSMIFMDIQMPEMNGYEATAQIRASDREDLKTVPIIAMSADVFMDDLKRAEDVGMNGHVAKPIEIEKLLEALEKWI